MVLQQGFHQPTAESRCPTCANHKSRSCPGTSPVLPSRTVLGATAWSQCFAPMSHVQVLTHTCTLIPSHRLQVPSMELAPLPHAHVFRSLLSRSHSLTVSLIFFFFFLPLPSYSHTLPYLPAPGASAALKQSPTILANPI